MAPAKRMKRLKEAGISPTIQRMAILKCLEESDEHPTADEVYSKLRQDYPTIARATVYNTLDALTKAGTILRLTIDPAACRYDADLEPHMHFRCRVCGRLFDIPSERPARPKHLDGHRVESIRTYAYGVCADCLMGDGEAADAPSGGRKKSKKNSSGRTTRKGGG